jgi:hypothetical protein
VNLTCVALAVVIVPVAVLDFGLGALASLAAGAVSAAYPICPTCDAPPMSTPAITGIAQRPCFITIFISFSCNWILPEPGDFAISIPIFLCE